MKYLLDTRPLILLYHRIADLDTDPWELAVHPRDFDRHLRALRLLFEIVPLSSLMTGGRLPRTTRRRLAITFDDGYLDNYTVAWPLLARHGIPATFFISSSNVQSGQEFWWDTLQRVFLGTANRSSAPRGHPAFIAEWKRLRDASPIHRDDALSDLCQRAGIDLQGPPESRPMSVDQLRSMSQSPLVEIGAHSVSHRRLATASAEHQRNEVSGSKTVLESICDAPVTSFSYPFGGADDYSSTTVDIVRRSGFQRAYTAAATPSWPDCGDLQIPRCYVPTGGVRRLIGTIRRYGMA